METLAMISTNLFTGIVILILAFIVRKGKAKFLLGTYNMMSNEEQGKWDVNALSKFTAWLFIVSSICLLIGCIPTLLDILPFISIFISWCVFSVIMIWGAIYRSISPRFKRR